MMTMTAGMTDPRPSLDGPVSVTFLDVQLFSIVLYTLLYTHQNNLTHYQ